MRRESYVLSAAAMAIGLVAAACSSSSNSGTATTSSTTAGGTSATASTSAATSGMTTTAPPGATTTGGTADLQSLIVTPANTQRTDGPEPVQQSGIHEHFLVNGSPAQVMDAFKTGLQGKGWSLTVQNSSGGGGGGGATYTGTNGGAYGVFTGGGYGSTTDVDACVWPTKPSNSDCGSHHG